MRAEDRRKLLAPDAEPSLKDSGLGCYLWLVGLLLVSLIGAIIMGSRMVTGLAVIFAALACVSIYWWYQWRMDLKRLREWADGNSVFGIVVTSDSPKWAAHIKDNWLTRFGSDISVLNYSRKRDWAQTVETKSVRRFNRYSDHCPVVIVPRKIGEPAVYRYYNAFVAAFHGDDEPLNRMEERMFEEYAEWQQRS